MSPLTLWAVVVGPRHVPVSIFDSEAEARAYLKSRPHQDWLELVALAHIPGRGYPWRASNRVSVKTHG